MTTSQATGQTPDFLVSADADERADLEAFGLTIEDAATIENPQDLAALTGAAAFYFRRIREVERERATTRAAMQKELDLITRCYEPQMQAADRAIAYLSGKVQEIARLYDAAGGFQKKKTVKTSVGDFGKKAIPERWTIAAPEATLAWAQDAMPEAVRVTVQMPLSDLLDGLQDDEAALPKGWTEKKREVLVKTLEEAGVVLDAAEIPGVQRTGGGEEWVVKPLLDGLDDAREDAR